MTSSLDKIGEKVYTSPGFDRFFKSKNTSYYKKIVDSLINVGIAIGVMLAWSLLMIFLAFILGGFK